MLRDRLPLGYRDCPLVVAGVFATRPIMSSAGTTRYTRKSLAYSREDDYHVLMTYAFMVLYHLAIQQASLTL